MNKGLKAALAGIMALLAASAGMAQLLPRVPLPQPLPDMLGPASPLDTLAAPVDRVRLSARHLADLRLARQDALVRAYPRQLEMTSLGPAVRGEVIALDLSAEALAAVRQAGFPILAEEVIEGLDIPMVSLALPQGLSLDRALEQLRRLAPSADFTPNHIHVQSGAASIAASTSASTLAQTAGGRGPLIGIIDGGVANHPVLRGPIQQRGFVRGAPAPSAHATAIASLVAGQQPVLSAAPGARLLVADVYGSDPAGGNAAAIARALGWMAERGAPVVAVSLVGPPNPLLARAVAQAQRRGMKVVAAVGNDGPASPPAYPASYSGVIAVTGIDGRGRVLIEAGRAAHLDYAAPGADLAAADLRAGLSPVRGTSYAVPLVAGRLAHHAGNVAGLDAEASHRGRRGYGRGLICGDCRTPIPKK